MFNHKLILRFNFCEYYHNYKIVFFKFILINTLVKVSLKR